MVAMWAMLAAPLIIGTDVPDMQPEITAILANKRLIAIDQDPVGFRRGWCVCAFDDDFGFDAVRIVLVDRVLQRCRHQHVGIPGDNFRAVEGLAAGKALYPAAIGGPCDQGGNVEPAFPAHATGVVCDGDDACALLGDQPCGVAADVTEALYGDSGILEGPAAFA